MSDVRAPLILVPGSLCDAELFTHQTARLGMDREVHVARLDRADTIEGMAADVLAAAPASFVLAGLSLGGIVAVEMHRQAPGRIEALALLATNLAAPGVAQLEQREAWDEQMATGRFDEVVDALLPVSTLGRGPLDAVVARMAHRCGSEVFRRQNAALRDRPDRRPWLEDVDVPVLVACGREDVVCPVDLHEEMAGRVRRGSLEVVEGAGHLVTLDRSEAVTGILHDWVGASAATRMR